MSRFAISAAVFAGMLAAAAPSAFAQQAESSGDEGRPAYYTQPKKIIINPNQAGGAPVPIGVAAGPVRPVPPQAGYVQLHAPLYPVPRPDVPFQVGATYITNPALSPHEMLYPHTYRALYPPYYYRVKGQWKSMLGTMNRYEHWELHGTKVEVEYCSQKPFLSRFSTIFSR